MTMLYKLESEGSTLLNLSNNITWSSDENGKCTLSFDSIHSLHMGRIVKFIIDGFEVFRGTVIECVEHKFTYTYTCYDYSTYLDDEVIKQFNKVNATAGLSSLLLEYNLKHTIVNIPTIIDKFYKDETITNIIDDVIIQCQNEQGVYYYKEIIGAYVNIKVLEDSYIYPKFIILEDSDINWSISKLKNKIIVISGGENTAKIEAEASDSYSLGKLGILQQIETVEDKDIAQAQNIANNLLAKLNRTEHSTTIKIVVLDRGETIRANRLIYIKTDKLKAGWYKIKSVNHTIESGVHTADIQLEW